MQSPAAPPEIHGLTLVQHLGGGGFADVYLYEQKALGRKVAVKVLRANASTEDVQRQFTAESRLMAALSDHINIVTIHDAAIARDGRPYLVMAYCPGLNLADRYKRQQMPVAEVLSIGVQLAGAVETAHRQGILHRDIKPANVLTAAGGRPALTDFGISVAIGVIHEEEESVGLSIPWSPPEMLSNAPGGDHRADVYSLAATLYTLLARRSPYELLGRSNDQIDLITRIQRTALTPTGRADVSRTVESVLATGLAKEPARRYQSALELARALQRLEAEMGATVTPVDISAEDPVAAQAELAADNDGRTRIRPLTIIHAQQSAGPATDSTQMRGMLDPRMARHPADGHLGAEERAGEPTVGRAGERADSRTTEPGASGPGAGEHTRLRGPLDLPEYLQAPYLSPQTPPDTQIRPAPESPETVGPEARRSRTGMFVGVGIAVLLLGCIGTVLAVRGTSAAPPPVKSNTPPQSAFVATVLTPSPASLVGRIVGQNVVFTWKDPSPQPGDYFEWQRTDAPANARWERLVGTTLTIPEKSKVCIDVNLVRQNGASSTSPASACSGKG